MLTARSAEIRPRGEDGRVAYLIRRFQALGLKPGGEHGGWTQAVPLVRYTIVGPVTLRLTDGGWSRPLTAGRDAVVATFRPVDRVQIENAPLVFLGRGRSAPSATADPAASADLSGKIALRPHPAQRRTRSRGCSVARPRRLRATGSVQWTMRPGAARSGC